MTSRFKHPSHEIESLKSKALKAALTILATHGVQELNLRAIAETAGIGIASMYHYFDGKDDLLLNLAIRGFEDLRADILRCQRDPEYVSPMRGGARAFFTFAQGQPALFSLMFDEGLMARHAALREAEHNTFLAYEASVLADDQIPKQYQEVAAFALWALGRGMAAILSSYPGAQPPEDVFLKLFAGASYLINHPD